LEDATWLENVETTIQHMARRQRDAELADAYQAGRIDVLDQMGKVKR
jgi:hypothetical protein